MPGRAASASSSRARSKIVWASGLRRSTGAGGLLAAGLDVHAGQRAEQRSVHDIGEGGVDPFPVVVLGRGGPQDRHAAERADHPGVEELDGRVEQPRGKIGRDEPGLEDADRAAG